MASVFDKFAKRYLKRPVGSEVSDAISFDRLFQLIKIYKMALYDDDHVDKNEFITFLKNNNYMIKDSELNIIIKPRRKESKLSQQLVNY